MDDIAVEIRILDYLQHRLSEAERREVEQLLETSPGFSSKFNAVKQVWGGLDLQTVPEISPSLKSDFQAMLKTFELEQELSEAYGWKAFWQKITAAFVNRPKYNWLYATTLFCLGALASWLYFKPQNNDVKNMRVEMNNRTQVMMLSMLQNPTAVERMKAVSYTQELRRVDDKVINALLTTLNTDPNENVRLVTLDALVRLAGNPKVRAGLVNSITKQDSELMQVALADAMLRLQEKSSLKPLKKVLENEDSGNDLIKQKLEQVVQKLESI